MRQNVKENKRISADQNRVNGCCSWVSLCVPEELLLGRSQKNPISNQASVAGAHTHSGHMANLPSSAVLFTAQ